MTDKIQVRHPTDDEAGYAFTWDPASSLRPLVGGIAQPGLSQVGYFALVDNAGDNLTYQSASEVVEALLQRFTPEAYGAIGNGIADDTAAVQAAIDAARDAGGGIVYFTAPKIYLVTGVQLLNTHRGVHLEGTAPHIDESEATTQATIRFNGSGTTGTALKVRRRGTSIKRLKFDVAAGKTARSGAELDNDAAGAGILTDVKFEDCLFFGAWSGTGIMTHGVSIGIADPAQYNQEFMKFERCRFEYQASRGLNIASATGQSKGNMIRDCLFYSCNTGIYVQSGSFIADGLLTLSALAVGIDLQSSSDSIEVLAHIDLELCGRLITKGNESAAQTISFYGGRLERDGLHADGNFIQYYGGGPITFHGTDFSGGVYSASWRAAVGSSAVTSGRAIFKNCIFPNITPLRLTSNYDVTLENCFGLDAATVVQPLENQRLRSARYLEPAEQLTNPVLWIKADEKNTAVFDVATQVARFSQANDLSGLNGSAVQATGAQQPKVLRNWRAGKPAIHFDSTARNLVVPDAAWLDVGVGSWLILMVAEWVGASAFTAFFSKVSNVEQNNIEGFKNVTDNIYTRHSGAGGNYAVSSFTWPTATPAIIGWGIDSVAAQTLYVKNQTVERASVTVSGTGSNALGLRLNADHDGTYPSGDFRLGELVMINRGAIAISTAEIQAAVAGLQLKWQIA